MALTSPNIIGSIMKLSDLPGAALEQERAGLDPGSPRALLTITVEILGPLMVMSGRYAWLGAGMLGVFTGLAILLVNRFWEMAGAARFVATNSFFEHIGLIAGFALAALAAEHDHRQHGSGTCQTHPIAMEMVPRYSRQVRLHTHRVVDLLRSRQYRDAVGCRREPHRLLEVRGGTSLTRALLWRPVPTVG